MIIRTALFSLVLGAVASLVSGAMAQSQPRPPASAAEVSAASAAGVTRLADAIGIGDILEVMRLEGVAHGAKIAVDLFDRQTGTGWTTVIGRIYDTEKMRAEFEAQLAGALNDDAALIDAGLAFFGSDLGRKIVALEISARKTLMEDNAKQAAESAYAELTETDPARSEQLDRFVARNGLVDFNVTGALNANLAFALGLREVGPLAEDITESQILADVWGQEESIRRETKQWLFSFLALAFRSLSDGELERYIAFSELPAGRRLNAAFFVAFDAMFMAICTELGRAAAQQIQAQDI